MAGAGCWAAERFSRPLAASTGRTSEDGMGKPVGIVASRTCFGGRQTTYGLRSQETRAYAARRALIVGRGELVS